MTADRAGYIAGLRALADALEADESLVLPYDGASERYSRLSVFTHTREQLQAYARAIPGRKDKQVTDSVGYGFELLGSLHGLHLRIYCERDAVCRRVVTGTREVEVPAQPAREAQPARTETVEDVEWQCEPLLTDAVSA